MLSFARQRKLTAGKEISAVSTQINPSSRTRVDGSVVRIASCQHRPSTSPSDTISSTNSTPLSPCAGFGKARIGRDYSRPRMSSVTSFDQLLVYPGDNTPVSAATRIDMRGSLQVCVQVREEISE